MLVKLTPEHGRHRRSRRRRRSAGGADGVSLINTIKSLMGVDLERMVPLPRVGGASTNGGYCGPAVKPIALHMVAAIARDVRAAAHLGHRRRRDVARRGRVPRARVVDRAGVHRGDAPAATASSADMIDGLSEWLDEHGMKSVRELVGRAVPAYQEWGDLDLSYKVVAKIDAGDVHRLPALRRRLPGRRAPVHLHGARGPSAAAPRARAKAARCAPSPFPVGALAGDRVPWVDEPECVGCNLCQLVCPVPGCITMQEVPNGARETWNDRVARGARQGARRHPRLRRLVSFGRTFALAASGLVAVREYGSSALLVS